MNERDRQTWELLVAQERARIGDEIEYGGSRDTNLEDSAIHEFQDTEPMTLGEWADRIGALERWVHARADKD